MKAMTKDEQFLEIAATFVNSPYIWGGKGSHIFKADELKMMPNLFAPSWPTVFDCSGLVTFCLKLIQASKTLDLPDMRGTHSAKTILDTFPLVTAPQTGNLLLYPQHVAIYVGPEWVLDANRGTSSIHTPQEARAKDASVQLHFNRRPDSTLLGCRRIPLDKTELRAI